MASADSYQTAAAAIAIGVLVTLASVTGRPDRITCIDMDGEMRERRFSFDDCCSAPVTNSSNIVVEIHGQNLDIDDSNMASLYFARGTIATYKCKTLGPSYSKQQWRCTRKGGKSLWEKRPPRDLVCDGKDLARIISDGHDGSSKPEPDIFLHPKPSDGHDGSSKPEPDIFLHPKPGEMPLLSGGKGSLLGYLLVGICSFLGFALFVALVYLLRRIRTSRTRPSGSTLLN